MFDHQFLSLRPHSAGSCAVQKIITMSGGPGKKILFIFFSILLFAGIVSCSTRKSKVDRSGLIPKDKLTLIVTDLYLADGLNTLPVVHHWYTPSDSLSAYKDVIEGFGYTKEQFDKTMRFYFIRKPKQMMKIYDDALAALTEMQTKADQEILKVQAKSIDFWNGKDFYTAPGDKSSDSTDFDITLPFWNYYTLSFTLTVFPDDESYRPAVTAFMCNPDSVDTGVRYYVRPVKYLKDGQPHKYVFKINDPIRTHRRLKGKIFDFGNNPEIPGRHFILEKIKLTY